MVIDVTGACLNAAMDQENFMIIDPKVVSVLQKIDPNVSKFKRQIGAFIKSIIWMSPIWINVLQNSLIKWDLLLIQQNVVFGI